MDITPILTAARAATACIQALSSDRIDAILRKLSVRITESTDILLEANREDLDRMDPSNPMYDRLLLTAERLEGIAADTMSVAALSSPVGELIESWTRPNGMLIRKVRVPFGVIGIIFEARPNVCFDVFSLCLKTQNVCLLKGGSDASSSNAAIVKLIRGLLEEEGVDPNVVNLMPSDRQATAQMLRADGLVDLIIPRGGRSLIKFVHENATVPTIETGAGICHTYVDRTADIGMAADIVMNAKTRRVSVCNALDCLVIHSALLDSLGAICAPLATRNVTVLADSEAYAALEGRYPAELLEHATEDSFGTEFLDYRMAIRTVPSLSAAIGHISRYTSHHSEAIVAGDQSRAERFQREIDAACVYHNVPTSFTDGAQFGLGAEIGISTQKMHARGPMALREITTYKYLISGNGQIRP